MARAVRLFEPARTVQLRQKDDRANRHDRGYDYDWAKAADAHLRAHPLCVECDRRGLAILADVVDHKIPVRLRPDLRLDPKNRWSLCHRCHNGIKRRLEAYAVAAGMIDQLIAWCDDPTSRPKALAKKRRPARQEMIV